LTFFIFILKLFFKPILKNRFEEKKLKQNPLDDRNCQRFCRDYSIRLFAKLPLMKMIPMLF